MLSNVRRETITADTLRAVMAPFRDSLARQGGDIQALKVVVQEHTVSLSDLHDVTEAHSRYLAKVFNPWNQPYRGP